MTAFGGEKLNSTQQWQAFLTLIGLTPVPYVMSANGAAIFIGFCHSGNSGICVLCDPGRVLILLFTFSALPKYLEVLDEDWDEASANWVRMRW